MLIEEQVEDLVTPSGPMRTYVYRPKTKHARRHTGVVLFSEIFQRTGPIHRIAALYAGHGFVVAVPEIFHDLEAPGTVLAYDQSGTDKGNFDKTAKTVAAYDADAGAVIEHLMARSDCNGTVTTMGVCIGGHLAFRCAFDERVRAAACFYATDIHKGSLGKGGDDSLARTKDIRGELMMVWGKQDPHIPEDGRVLIRNRLVEAGTNFTWHEYNAQHAFLRDEGHRYDPALAVECHRRVIDLFSRA